MNGHTHVIANAAAIEPEPVVPDIVPEPPVPDPEPQADESEPAPKGLLELRSGDCRWPIKEAANVVGGQLFCGRTAVQGSYCRRHAALAFSSRVR